MSVKTCSRCGITKSVEEFCKNHTTRDGLQYWCRECLQRYRLEHRETHRLYCAQYYREHREQGRLCNAKWNREHRNEHRLYETKWRQGHPGCLRASIERWHQNNPAAFRAHRMLQTAVRYGKVSKPDHCSVCNALTEAQDLHGHHDSYAPKDVLQIRWLCRTCHAAWHIKAREAAVDLEGHRNASNDAERLGLQ